MRGIDLNKLKFRTHMFDFEVFELIEPNLPDKFLFYKNLSYLLILIF